jgi:hypothetical protein
MTGEKPCFVKFGLEVIEFDPRPGTPSFNSKGNIRKPNNYRCCFHCSIRINAGRVNMEVCCSIVNRIQFRTSYCAEIEEFKPE